MYLTVSTLTMFSKLTIVFVPQPPQTKNYFLFDNKQIPPSENVASRIQNGYVTLHLSF